MLSLLPPHGKILLFIFFVKKILLSNFRKEKNETKNLGKCEKRCFRDSEKTEVAGGRVGFHVSFITAEVSANAFKRRLVEAGNGVVFGASTGPTTSLHVF